MNNLEFLNNYIEPVCAFLDNQIIFKNKSFINTFNNYSSLDRFKKQFNFNLCFLSSENIANLTPIDILLKSRENFHTICTFQNKNGEYIYYYIYTFKYLNYIIAVFKDITSENSLENYRKNYYELEEKYKQGQKDAEKYSKLQEHAQAQVLKMAIINRLSLVIRETNNIETILSSALGEINNLLGSYKTYFSVKNKNNFKIKYIIPSDESEINRETSYEKDVLDRIKNKNIAVSSCLKEYTNSKTILQSGITRIIIPIYNKNKLLGIIVTLTRQKFKLEDNIEILESISVQLSSSLIQSGLIEQLNKKNKKLEKTLSQLKETQVQLINTEKMASIGQLVSGIAHEINTPLASISSNTSMISKLINSQNSTDEKKTELLKELNDINLEASRRISDIVLSLKRFVRLDEAQFQEADINNELDLTLKLMAHELKNNIKVIKYYSKLPPILCSVNMLNQVFMNLLVNACHSINEKSTEGEITISTAITKGNLEVKIKDNGIGIKKEIQNKIFNAGFTTKKSGLGTGLGLAISKKIVELHKGNISFISKENQGSEFTVSIPINKHA